MSDRLTIEQIFLLVPREKRDGKFLCPRCHLWHLSINTNTADVHCFSPECENNTSEIAALIWHEVKRRQSKQTTAPQWNGRGFTLAEYAALKKLPIEFLKAIGTTEEALNGRPAVRHTYLDESGNPTGYKYRLSDSSHNTCWEKYDKQSVARGVYGLQSLALGPERIVIVEGESDQQTLTYQGIDSVGISGIQNWRHEIADFAPLKQAREILVVQEPGAEKFARIVAGSFPYGKARVLSLPVKDPSQLWIESSTPESFRESWDKAVADAKLYPPLWKERFHVVDELPDGDITFLIEEVLPEGVVFIGALSGAGKTWFCLAMARALTTGKKFLGNWTVPEPVDVLYLCPEMSAKTFKKGCKRFGISDRFHCQTIADGVPLELSDPLLAAAIHDLKPVVFLDTAIRFANVEDENSASQNAQGLAKAVFRLLHLGARAVVCLHHRAKETAKSEELTLENTLRGTGDLGAMCDAVWGLQYDRPTGDAQHAKESRRLVRLSVSCVKARDFVPPEDFRIQLEPFIDQIGDMAVLTDDSNTASQSESERLDAAIAANQAASIRQLEKETGVGRNRIPKLAATLGWTHDDTTGWERTPTA